MREGVGGGTMNKTQALAGVDTDIPALLRRLKEPQEWLREGGNGDIADLLREAHAALVQLDPYAAAIPAYDATAIPADGLPHDSIAMRLAWRWLGRQTTGVECQFCGAAEGEDHEPTDPCGLVANLLRELRHDDSVGWHGCRGGGHDLSSSLSPSTPARRRG